MTHNLIYTATGSSFMLARSRTIGKLWGIADGLRLKITPEYLMARRGNRLILNLVDVENPAYIADEIMDTAVAEIHRALSNGQQVLVHCNLGQSRSPSIAMLYLGVHTARLPLESFEAAKLAFLGIYPPFAPAGGTQGFLQRRWPSLR